MCVGAGLAAAVLGGCAVTLPAAQGTLLLGYASHGDAGATQRHVVPGLDLDLFSAWPGVRLGWTDVTVAAAVPARVPEPAPQREPGAAHERDADAVPDRDADAPAGDAQDGGFAYAPPLGLRWRGDGAWHALGWVTVPPGPARSDDAPFFVSVLQLGLSADWAAECAGLNVGLSRLTLISCPPMDGAWALSVDGSDVRFHSLQLEMPSDE
jgi:hypothetical protein